jgi:uncharacterized membrane protein YraQ (UPF0718 family)
VSTLALIASIAGYVVFCALMIVPLWRAYARAGLSPYLTLIFAVPLAGPLVVLLLLAFLRWPALDRVRR